MKRHVRYNVIFLKQKKRKTKPQVYVSSTKIKRRRKLCAHVKLCASGSDNRETKKEEIPMWSLCFLLRANKTK